MKIMMLNVSPALKNTVEKSGLFLFNNPICISLIKVSKNSAFLHGFPKDPNASLR